MTKTYIITAAQNATPVHRGFFGALQQFVRHNDAELIVVPFRYRNPTAPKSWVAEGHDWWADEVLPFLAARVRRAQDTTTHEPKRRQLCPGLAIFADISIQPTASNPLSGFEVFAGHNSGIFGHTQRALQVVPTATRTPRIMFTTSACTVPNYSDTKAGKKGRAHHVIGALVVEVDADGTWFARHVSADAKGTFTDLDTQYSEEGAYEAPPALTLTLGDYHAGREEEAVLAATERLCKAVRPKYVVLHDVLDFRVRNHHQNGDPRAKYGGRYFLVEHEVEHAVQALRRVKAWGDHQVVVVRSNHDEAFERWMREHSDDRDTINAPYYHAMWARAFDYRDRNNAWPNLFELEARRLGIKKRDVRFLKRNESFCVKGVEHAFHGDHGPNGARGSTRNLARLGAKVTKAHDHTACIMYGVYSVGVTAGLDHGYNNLPSTWVHAQCVEHADGKRQLIVISRGRYRGGDVQ